MDNFIKSISALAAQKLLYPAEQIISSALVDYETIFSQSTNLSDTDIEHVEFVLLKLLEVNNGILSLQCCFRIAECLLMLYKRSSPPRVWNLFQQFSDNSKPSAAAILTTGFVINSIGSNIKSKIPGFVTKLLSLPVSITTSYEQINMQNTTVNVTVNINYSIPSMISFIPCFKKCQKDMKNYVNKTFDYAKRAVKSSNSSSYLAFINSNYNSSTTNYSNNGYYGNSSINNGFCANVESHQLFSLKLVRSLIKFREIPLKTVLAFSSKMIENAKSSFVIDETCYLIAKTALFYKINDKEDDEDENNEYYNRNQVNSMNDNSSNNTSEEPSGAGDNGIEWMMNKQKKKLDSKPTKNKFKKYKEEDLPGMPGLTEITESKSNYEENDDDCLFAERFNEAFQIFIEFKKYFPQILRHFLDILNPLLIFTNLPVIFKNIRVINSDELTQLISLFGSEVRQELFHQVASESPPTTSQLHILRALQNLEGNKVTEEKKEKNAEARSTDDSTLTKVNFNDNNDLNYYSNSCQKEISALALQLCQSESTSIRNEGASSFAWLAKTNPNHAKLYLETATLYLAYPPEDNPKIQTDIRAFGSIAQSILGACIMSNKQGNKNDHLSLNNSGSSSSVGNILSSTSTFSMNSLNYMTGSQKNWRRDEMANSVADNINRFLDRALVDVDIFDSSFFAAFSIMTVLPDYLIPSSLAAAAVSLFSEYLISHQKLSELDSQRLKFVAQEICLFLTAHSGYECFARFLRTIYDKPFLFTQTTMLALLIEIPKNAYVMNSSSFRKVLCDLLLNSMNPYFLKAIPKVEHVKYRLKYPMKSPSEILNSTVFIKPKHPIIYCKLQDDVYAYKILEHYAKYVEAIIQKESSKATSSSFSTSFFNSVLSSLFQSSNTNENSRLMCHSLIHSLCLNETTKKCFSSTFYKQMISTMSSANSALFDASKISSLKSNIELARIQISAESIALFANHFGNNSKFLNDILQFVKEMSPGPVKCFIYSSLFAHCKLSINQLTSMMNELDKFALNPSMMPYALHALSVLFKVYSLDLLKMKVPDTQFQVILNLLNSPNTLQPFNLYFTSQCFTSLLAVISPDFAEDQRQQEIDEIQEIHDKLDSLYNNKKEENKDAIVQRKKPSGIRMLVPTLNLIIEAFDNIQIPYSKQIFFHTVRAVFAFASDALNVPNLVFPTSRGISMSLWISACGAFTDLINTNILKERKKELHMQNIEQVKLQYKQKQLKNQNKEENIDSFEFNINNNNNDNNNEINEFNINNIFNNEDYFYLIPRNLLLLQRSCDERILQFVVTISKKFLLDIQNIKNDAFNSKRVRKRVTEWCKIFSSVLASNVLPETGIESAPIVKRCCLESAVFILDILSKSEPLMTENLDDIITIITRAIETRKTILLKDAYLLLTDVIKKFENRITTVSNSNVNSDGIRLLLLYDSQFSIAVRTGFICNLQYSGKFLIEYLHFHLEDLKTRPEDFENVLNSYIKGLMTCTQRTYAYYAVAAHLICLARENKIVFEMINRIDEVSIENENKNANTSPQKDNRNLSFAMSIITQLCEIFSISMALWRSTPPDWQQISQFRTNYASFYRDIVVAFVWLQGVLGTEFISLQSIIDFECDELSNCTESWRVLAAFDVVTTAFLVTPQKIKHEQIEKVTQSVKKASERFPQLLSSSVIEKFFNVCRMISDSLINNTSGAEGITSEQLNALSESSKFDPEATAEVIVGTEIGLIAKQLNDRILSEFVANNITPKEFLALSTLMFDSIGKTKSDNSKSSTEKDNIESSTEKVDSKSSTEKNNIENSTEKVDSKSSTENDVTVAAGDGFDEDVRQKMLKLFLSKFLEKIGSVSDDQISLNYLTRILKRIRQTEADVSGTFSCPIPLAEFDEVAKFSWSRFKVGGMFLITELLIENTSPLGLSLFLYKSLEVIKVLILNDILNASVYIQFITMGVSLFADVVKKVNNEQNRNRNRDIDNARSILIFLCLIESDSGFDNNEIIHILNQFFLEILKKTAIIQLSAISIWGPDLRGEDVIKNAAYFLRCLSEIENSMELAPLFASGYSEINSPLRNAFDEIGERERTLIVRFTENEEQKAERNKIAANKLKVFSSAIEKSGNNENKRKLRNVKEFDSNIDEYDDDDWESL